MLTTDLILLFAMAASPAPGASSLHPVASEIRLAQAGGWRDNQPPRRRPPLSACGRGGVGCGLKAGMTGDGGGMSRAAGTGSGSVPAGSGTEAAGNGKATTTAGFREPGARARPTSHPRRCTSTTRPRLRPRLRSWRLHLRRVRASSGSRARTSGATDGTSGPRVAGNPNDRATTGGPATGIATAAGRRGIQRAGSTATTTTANHGDHDHGDHGHHDRDHTTTTAITTPRSRPRRSRPWRPATTTTVSTASRPATTATGTASSTTRRLRLGQSADENTTTPASCSTLGAAARAHATAASSSSMRGKV